MKSASLGAALLAFSVAWAPPTRAASALSMILPDLARGMGPLPPNSLVVVGPLASDTTAPRGEELALRLAALIAGQLGASARASPHIEPLSVARALAAKWGGLVYVEVAVKTGQIQVTANVYPVLSNVWDRIRVPLPAPKAHAFASAPIDAEVRSFLSPLSLEQARVHKARHDLGDVLAVSCGDIDGQGANELVLVTRAVVARGRIQADKFLPSHVAPWSALAAREPVPLREPLATAAIVRSADETGGDILVGMSDRGGVRLSRDLRGAAPLVGLPVLSGRSAVCVSEAPSASAFEGSPLSCESRTPVDQGPAPPPFDAVAMDDLVRPDGTSVHLLASRDPAGHLHLFAGHEEDARALRGFDRVGAQLALADLDQDGVTEVITTRDSVDDSISIWSWRDHQLTSRLKIPAALPVRALTVCPSGERGLRPIVAIVGAEVWLVR